MENRTITELGRLMFGNYWVAQAAEAIGISARHMQRIAANTQPVNPGIARDMIALAHTRVSDLQAAIELAAREYGTDTPTE